MNDFVEQKKEDSSIRLLNLMAFHFDLDELKTLCFKLGIDHENLKGAGKVGKVRELILYTSRNNRLNELLISVKQERPSVNWPKTVVIPLPESDGKDFTYIPSPNYQRFIGRSKELQEILGDLRNPKGNPIIAIIGLGGIGKTALAQKVIENTIEEKILSRVVWISFKVDHFISETIHTTDLRDSDYHEVLSKIGRQCYIPDFSRLSLLDKESTLKSYLNANPSLIVLDNLETMNDADEQIFKLFQLLGKSKLLITSRYQIKHKYTNLRLLKGLEEDDAVSFLREDSQVRGISRVSEASRENLLEIAQVTDGHPLAMQLVIGQMIRYRMKTVLQTLKQADFKSDDEQFYRFLYKTSWDILELNAKLALVALAEFPANTGGFAEDIEEVSQINTEAFWIALSQLVTFSLVNIFGDIGKERYALHSLTRYFIKSDITEEWEKR